MPEATRFSCRYRILRYVPNLLRDEWVNIGVLLEQLDESGSGPEGGIGRFRRELRLIEEDADIARVRRLHPNLDENLLRSLPGEFDARLRAPESEVSAYLEKLDQTLSNALQLGPQKGLKAEDFDAELDRLFLEQVSPLRGGKLGILEGSIQWLRKRVSEVFRRRQLLPRLQQRIRVDEFTQPGDPTRIDYGYRFNGTRGYLQIVPLRGDTSRAKVFAYTAECIRRRAAHTEFAALTESEPAAGNPRHDFVRRLFEDQQIAIVAPSQLDRFAEQLRPRLQ